MAGASNLNESEQVILDRQLNGLTNKDSPQPKSSLFEYASTGDKLVLVLSAATAIISGALNPLLTVVYGRLVGVFDEFASGSLAAADLRSDIATYSLYYVYLGIGLFVFTYVSTVGFYLTGERVTRNLRRAYLKAILRQNMAFFDTLSPGEVTSRIMSDMGRIQEGLTSKLQFSLAAVSTFGSAFIIAFVMFWKTALIMSPTYVVMIASASIGGAYAVKYHKQAIPWHGKASGLAEESITSVRHICAYGIGDLLTARYSRFLTNAGINENKSRLVVATMIAWKNAMPCLVYALSFWAGSIYITRGEVSVANVTTTTLVITIGGWAIARVAPSIQAFVQSISSASVVLEAISRRSPQDPFGTEGRTLDNVHGDIELRQVSLRYPTRKNVLVLNQVSFTCPAGKRTAIVGPSGGGKSSIVGMLERFYEPTGGQILLDQQDIQQLKLSWLRAQVSLVSQEPVLFNASIFQNILYGIAGSAALPTDAEARRLVEAAATKANAHDFIKALPDGYDTNVGEKGAQLSGGQRQRVAIARALIKDPKVLILDEATSALDIKSEAAVQKALDAATEHRTSIVIAHRLSTIRHADKIVVLSGGNVAEEGTHDELVSRGGLYASMVRKQQIDGAETKNQEITGGVVQRDPEKSLGESSTISNIGAADVSTSKRPETAAGAEIVEDHRPLTIMQTLSFITRMNRPEAPYLFVGFLSAVFAGFAVPAQSVLFAKVLEALAYPPSQYDLLRSSVNFYGWLYFMMAWLTFFFWIGVGLAFTKTTGALSRRIREKTFGSLLRQDMAYFDHSSHSVGALASLLSTSTDDLTGLSGPVIGSILTFTSTIITGIVFAVAIGWKLGLICTACIPLVVACGWIRLQMLAIVDGKVRQSGKESAAYASELVRSVKTVASLGLEIQALQQYDDLLSRFAADSLRSIFSASALYAASNSVTFFCAALVFWYGGNLIADNEYTLFQFYVCFVALISGSQIAATLFSYAPDASKAMHAGKELRDTLDLQPEINSGKGGRDLAVVEKDGCHVELEHVSLRYPARPEHLSLNGFSLDIIPGQTVALVGSSGSGKSTVISAVERFYNPEAGFVRVDGRDVSEYDVRSYRGVMSLVSQDSFLFTGSIRENIAIGLAGQEISDEALLDVCKKANISDFIASLPEGLDTDVGSFGGKLSGGQKQRIAIARALLRSPRLLLLDEATAALDTTSEQVVQQALDAASDGRTTIVAAHRLSTIKDADVICVLEQGRLVEKGTHNELMNAGGRYRDLVSLQDLK